MARRTIKPTKSEIGIDFGRANPKQAQFYTSKTKFTAYGGARGGGKSHAVRIKAFAGALEWPGIKILVIRKTYNDLDQNHIMPLKKMIPNSVGVYNGSAYAFFFINGSMIKFGHLNGASSADEYQGQEYDWIFIDEATQFTESAFRTLGGCLRGVNDFPKRIYLTANPGGIGHSWVKRLFIDRNFKTNCENPEENENPDDYSFIFATVEDNTELMESSPDYVKMLASLPESIRRAHRYGDWNAIAGGFFPEFSSELHVIKQSEFTYPPDWKRLNRYRALDYGYDMLACYWIAIDLDGRCYVYREVTKPNLNASEAVQEILNHTMPDENIITTYIPPDLWKRSQIDGKTVADVFMQAGIGISRANNDLFTGGMQIKEMLRIMPDGKPNILFFDNCPQIIEHLQEIQVDDKDPNKYAKVPHDITHSVDAIRYFCISRTITSEPYVPDPEPDYDSLVDYDEFMTGGEATASYINY